MTVLLSIPQFVSVYPLLQALTGKFAKQIPTLCACSELVLSQAGLTTTSLSEYVASSSQNTTVSATNSLTTSKREGCISKAVAFGMAVLYLMMELLRNLTRTVDSLVGIFLTNHLVPLMMLNLHIISMTSMQSLVSWAYHGIIPKISCSATRLLTLALSGTSLHFKCHLVQ
jgi:hypothetical protein